MSKLMDAGRLSHFLHPGLVKRGARRAHFPAQCLTVAFEHHRIPIKNDDNSDAFKSDSDAKDGGTRKRRRLSDDADAEGDDLVRLFAKLRQKYYRLGTFHGKPSGVSCLAQALRKNTNECSGPLSWSSSNRSTAWTT
jgi:hypothetical protein